jgi:hypothetical protein
MLNTNVGDMPLDIFADYTSDTLEQEWSWEYLACLVNDAQMALFYEYGNSTFSHSWYYGNGVIYGYHDWLNNGYNEIAQGNGVGYLDSKAFARGCGNGCLGEHGLGSADNHHDNFPE